MNKVAIVTGGSSGIGHCVAEKLSATEYRVYEFSRTGKSFGNVVHIDCDVSKTEDVCLAVKKVMDQEENLDLVVNCAGFGISGAIEYTTISEAKRQFDVNFFGTAEVNRACIPYLKKTKGRIINISSVAAMASIPFQAYYSACKAAVNSYTLALENELKPFGISVCAVMPGDTSTGFTDARNKNIEGDEEYNGRISSSVRKMENDERKGAGANEVAALICRIAKKRKVKPIYTAGLEYRLIVILLKILPYRISNSLISKIYG
ncbi:MAG: SDR family NAD(P)-dependent oxidoreductase [Erysipelotrichaceae bacterium]|nr:SDR family NAD(P)-dependent oxidoreductase [Erysipelotrichaceae bacterium]